MRRIFFLVLITAALMASANDGLRLRADRSYDWDDYAGSAAMYEVLISRAPSEADLYTRAIVSHQMLGDTLATVDLMQRAMAHNIGLGDMLAAVRTADFEKGRADLFGSYLLNLRNAMPWMSRALDNQLLEYYDFRNDGAMIEHYARIMLAPIPESVPYLNALARGLMLQGRIPEAIEIWTKIQTLDPDDPTSRLYLEATRD